MRASNPWGVIAAGFAAGVAAQSSTATTSSAASLPTDNSNCAKISRYGTSYFAQYPNATSYDFPPSWATACLNDIPLLMERSIELVDYIASFVQYQSTVAYLKNPPQGYLVPGVDLFAGFATIKAKLSSGGYANQLAFEKELDRLINILPFDGHLNFNLPLSSLFSFYRPASIVAVSTDGLSLPQVYFGYEVAVPRPYTPSPIVSIDGKPIVDYIQQLSLVGGLQDPDALWNQVFFSAPARAIQGSLGFFNQGAYRWGFESDNSTYQFANGSSIQLSNIASSTSKPSTLSSVVEVINAYLLPPPPSQNTNIKRSEHVFQKQPFTVTKRQSNEPITKLASYPKPVVIQPEGYTSGYFLDASSGFADTAVLVANSFQDNTGSKTGNQNQQELIREFLALCRAFGKSKLIIDLSSNPGGSLFNGYDFAKQLFPTLVPFGGSRYVANPAVEYLLNLLSTGPFDANHTSVYQTQASLDVNLQPFASAEQMFGPHTFQGANFSSELRYNLSNPTQSLGNGIVVSGYANRTDIPPSVFGVDDIVILLDGACSSTCTTFTGMIKGQLNVRTIAVGGRPMNGPMQGVGGVKGAQHFTYSTLLYQYQDARSLYLQYVAANVTYPVSPEADNSYYANITNPPLGPVLSNSNNPGFNLRNAYRANDASQTPEQFVYEAANCRLFYTASDIGSYSSLWARVANAAWGNGTCVPGSTVNANNTISSAAIPFSAAAMSNATFPSGPGSLNGTTATSPTTSPTTSSTGSGTPATTTPTRTGGAAGQRTGWNLLGMAAAAAMFAALA